MTGITLIIAFVMIMELVATRLNRSMIKSHNVYANLETFNVRYTNFSIFFSIVMCISLASFAYLFIDGTGAINSNVIVIFTFLLITFFDLLRRLFFKIEITNESINLKTITRRSYFSFEDVKNVTIAKAFQHVQTDIFSDNGRMFTLRNDMAGYQMFIERLKREHVDWRHISGKPINKSDV